MKGVPGGLGGLTAPWEAPFVYYMMFLGRGGAVFRLEMNKKVSLPVPGGAPLVYDLIFSRQCWAVFRLEVNKEGGSPVPGEAPFVHDIMFFGARLGCIPSADE